MADDTHPISRLSLERMRDACDVIDPTFVNTPQFHTEPISDELGVDVVLKVETVNPIRSFKGRGADLFVSRLPENPPTLVCASAGNFGQGLAYAARKRGIQVVVFAAETANASKLQRMDRLGAAVRLVGRDFDEAKREARSFAAETGSCFVEDGRDPAISEGAGTIGIEMCRFPERFDFLVAPLGNGALLAGVGRWLKAYSPTTRIVAVCAAGAPAMALSLKQRTVRTTESMTTIADGIGVRVPVAEAVGDLQYVVDDVVLVNDDSMIDAMRLVFRHQALVLEPAGAAGLAALLQYRERFRGSRVATVLSGGNLTPEQMRDWLL